MVVINEKVLGGLTSAVSGSAAGGLMFLGVQMGLSAPTSSAVFLYGVGNLLAYTLDVMFAQRSPGGKEVPYSAVAARFRYFLNSLVTPQFLRFIVTVIIDSLVGIALLKAAIKYMDTNDILTGFKYRDAITSILIAFFTFVLYVNTLRFDWAYGGKGGLTLDFIVFMWASMALLMFAITYVMSDATSVGAPVVAKVGEEGGVPIANRWGAQVAL